MSSDTTDLQEQLRTIIPQIVDVLEGIDSEEIAELLGVPFIDADDVVTELFAEGVLAAEGDEG